MTKVRSANPDIEGNSTSVNIRSMSCGRSFKVSHAIKPSGTAATTEKNLKLGMIKTGEITIILLIGRSRERY